MSQFVALPSERGLLYSPVAFQTIDRFTGKEPIGRVSLSLQEQTGLNANDWSDISIAPHTTAGDIYSYPGLGRAFNPAGQIRTHRVLIDSDFYEVPEVKEFVTHLYDDDHPLDPGFYAQEVDKVILTPSSRYPYDSHIPLLRGKVTRGKDGPPLQGIELRHQSLGVFSDGDGNFTLPVQRPASDTHTTARSELNSIKVENARGYVQATLSVVGFEGQSFRVLDVKFKDNAPPNDYGATLSLEPSPGSDDLPEGIPARTNVSLNTFAILIDVPPRAILEVDQVFDVPPKSSFNNFHKITIPATP